MSRNDEKKITKRFNIETMAEELDITEVSKTISKALNISSIGDLNVLMSKFSTKVKETMAYCLSDVQVHFGGSSAEGSQIKGSDFDMMTVIPEITVCTRKTKEEPLRGHVFVFEPTGRPGYGRLRMYRLNDDECIYFKACKGSIKDMLADSNDGTFLSSTKFVSFFVSLPKKLGFNTPIPIRHGPSAMSQSIYSESDIQKTLNEKDNVNGLVCDAWPVAATEWIRRERYHDWPKKETISRISKFSCHAVPVGDTRSKHYSTEWRISFMLGERELVWEFSNTQVQCYVLLKNMLKMFIQPLSPDQISSYHVKTVMLWMSEQKADSFWKAETLMRCVEECLEMLQFAVENRALEHYFHRQANLFGYKFENIQEKLAVVNEIKKIKSDIISYILESIRDEWGDLSKNWLEVSGNVNEFIGKNKSINRLNELYHKEEDAHNTILMYRHIFHIFRYRINYDHDKFADRQVNQLKSFSERIPAEVLIRSFFIPVKWFLSIRIGMLYCRYLTVPREKDWFQTVLQEKSITINDALSLIEGGSRIDFMSGKLYAASVCLCQKDFRKSNEKVRQVLKQKEYLVYPGECSKMTKIHFLDGVPVQGPNIRKNNGKICIAYDVLFSASDIDCVPYPVKFECVTVDMNSKDGYDIVVFHPCVYAEFLLCIGYFYTNEKEKFKEILQQLTTTVNVVKGGLYRHRALNLLGYCYYLDGNLNRAFECFRESLQEDDIKRWRNKAALYHICILMLNMIGRSTEEEILYERKSFDDKP